jgi:protein-disulfide isomerase
MRHLSKFLPILAILMCFPGAFGQRLDDVLATSTNATYTAASLSPEGQKLYLGQRKLIADTRAQLLSEMIANTILDLESKALNSTPEKLIAAQRVKVSNPSAADIQKVYNANAARLGGRTLAEVRGQIVDYLRHDPEQKAVDSYILALRTKYKVSVMRDVNAVGLAQSDVLAAVGGRNLTFGEFEKSNAIRVNDTEIDIFEEIGSDLETSIFSAVVGAEAKSRNIDTGTFIETEITDKLRQFTDEERADVESALKRQLFGKYNVKILLNEPLPLVQNILVEADDPQTGSPTAPVTVVMFTDFQCPTCSRIHPLLKQTLAAYGDKIRFVVRDFPLESIHENALHAALAANAARAQGKFFEYAEVLYRNQEALDKVSLLKYATELGLNAKQFELDSTNARTEAEVRKDLSDGRSYGVGGTPTIFVNGVKVHRLSVEAFRRAIDRALSK